MSERKLKARTIVPEDLYVERAADRQLREIVGDMGRPGYVLVARQMGKTNLLLHMKRQQVNSHVLYFDLSSRFASARHWFRNIIDGLLESLQEQYVDVVETIVAQRETLHLEPNVEYDRHLRMILRKLNRKTIIILDEIDSLINTSYSDAIFAQIRSMYFSRANHPEYENLTYVLSGVVEPTELIRDKNISPFNIGEKIYLENFDQGEVESFISKSGLELPGTVIDRLFEWTDGNPRMTWDISSELEVFTKRGEPTADTVDKIVQKLYLDQYDRPPIDHIRTLVAADKKIRDAVVAMRYSRGGTLDQNTKNKLYLAGVTNAAGGDVKIANKIVDLALNEDWMESISVSSGIAPILLVISRGDFRQAVSLLTELRSSPDKSFSAQEERLLADSHLRLGEYGQARDEYISCLEDRPNDEVKQCAHFGLAVTYNELGIVPEARENFTLAMTGPDKNLSKLATLYNASLADESDSSISAASEGVSQIQLNESDDDNFRLVFKSYVLYILSKRLKRNDDAEGHLQTAISHAQGDVAHTLQLISISSMHDRKTRVIALRKFCEHLMQTLEDYPIAGDAELSFGVRRMLELLRLLLKNGLVVEAIDLARHYGQKSFAEPVSAFAAIKDLYLKIVSHESPGAVSDLLEFAIKYLNPENQPTAVYLDVLAELIGHRAGPNPDRYRQEFTTQLKVNRKQGDILGDKLLHALSMLALKCLQDRDWRFAKEVFFVWEIYREDVKDGGLNRLMLDFIQMRCLGYRILVSDLNLHDAARRVLDSFTEGSTVTIDPSAKEITNAFRKEALEILEAPLVKTSPEPDPYKTFGRNDRVVVRYPGAIPVQKKFKQVELDLRSGDCSFVRLVQKSKN
jgi:tetratricopeptide (TPR) repeat protein